MQRTAAVATSNLGEVSAKLGRKWLVLWVALLILGMFPVYVLGKGVWRFGFDYVSFGCCFLNLLLIVGLARFRPIAIEIMAVLLAGSSLLSLALFYRAFDGGGIDWLGIELRIVLAIVWASISLTLAHFSTLLAYHIRLISNAGAE